MSLVVAPSMLINMKNKRCRTVVGEKMKSLTGVPQPMVTRVRLPYTKIVTVLFNVNQLVLVKKCMHVTQFLGSVFQCQIVQNFITKQYKLNFYTLFKINAFYLVFYSFKYKL